MPILNKRTVPAPNKQGFFLVITTLPIQCNMYLHSICIVLGIRRNPDMTERAQKGAGMLCANLLAFSTKDSNICRICYSGDGAP